jgi:translation initiation factor 6 (eIF-6)
MTFLVLDHVWQESLQRPVMRYDVDIKEVVESLLACVENGVLVSHSCVVYENAHVSDPRMVISQPMYYNIRGVRELVQEDCLCSSLLTHGLFEFPAQDP